MRMATLTGKKVTAMSDTDECPRAPDSGLSRSPHQHEERITIATCMGFRGFWTHTSKLGGGVRNTHIAHRELKGD